MVLLMSRTAVGVSPGGTRGGSASSRAATIRERDRHSVPLCQSVLTELRSLRTAASLVGDDTLTRRHSHPAAPSTARPRCDLCGHSETSRPARSRRLACGSHNLVRRAAARHVSREGGVASVSRRRSRRGVRCPCLRGLAGTLLTCSMHLPSAISAGFCGCCC